MNVAATFFDGQISRAQPVVLSRPDATTLVIEGDSMRREVRIQEITTTSEVGHIPRFVYLPDGARCEVPRGETLDELLRSSDAAASPGWIGWLQARAQAVAAVSLLLVAAAAFGFQWILPKLVQRVVQAVPASVERRMSDSTLAALDRSLFRPTGLSVERRWILDRRFRLLVEASGYKGPTHLIFRQMRDGSANAFALPNGNVVIADHLVMLANDDEAVAVLAHELGHLVYRHALRRLLQNSATLVLVTTLTGDTTVIGNLATSLPLALMSAKYSREFETEADLYALVVLKKAGVAPSAFLSIMRKLQQEFARKHSEEPPVYLSSHPPTEERIKRYEQASAAAQASHASDEDSKTPEAESTPHH
jgi:predicted Zn-dependent protease